MLFLLSELDGDRMSAGRFGRGDVAFRFRPCDGVLESSCKRIYVGIMKICMCLRASLELF